MKYIKNRLLNMLLLCGLILPLLFSGGEAVAVTFTIGSASGMVGDTVSLPVTVTDLSEDIWSYEVDISWYHLYANCIGINTTGTLSENWSVSDNPDVGTISVTGASAMPLAEDGVIFELLLELGPSSGNPIFYLGSVFLNEGGITPDLVNGNVIISALPPIYIAPNSGLMAVGDSIHFSTSNGSEPYVYTSSDPAIADFDGSWLHGVGPGFVEATTEDADASSATTYGQIEVRPFRLTVEASTGIIGQPVYVPITLDDPTAFSIVSAEIELSWHEPYAAFAGIELSGTIAEAAGWSAPVVNYNQGLIQVIMAGASPLTSSGVLFYLKLMPTHSVSFSLISQVFNETYLALPTVGYLTVNPLPSFGLSANTASLLVGQQVQLSTYGSPTAPIIWSTDDAAVATIDAFGLLTAISEGSVHVLAEDALGSTAESGEFTVCGLALPALSSSIEANETVLLPVKVDRVLGPLGIYSYEMVVTYSQNAVNFVGAQVAGSITSNWGSPVVVDDGGVIHIYHAGGTSLSGCGPALIYLEFQGLPSLTYPYTGVVLNEALFNEGTPCTRVNVGEICDETSPAPQVVHNGLRLWPNFPNPFNPSTTIQYTLEKDGEMELAVYSARGELVRVLATGFQTAGITYHAVWDGRDESGRAQSSGVYYSQLRSVDQEVVQKMVLLK